VGNGAANDTEPMMSNDGCEFYFASDRSGGEGSLDIYRCYVVAQ
jgi:Tol biopolymer transport system component